MVLWSQSTRSSCDSWFSDYAVDWLKDSVTQSVTYSTRIDRCRLFQKAVRGGVGGGRGGEGGGLCRERLVDWRRRAQCSVHPITLFRFVKCLCPDVQFCRSSIIHKWSVWKQSAPLLSLGSAGSDRTGLRRVERFELLLAAAKFKPVSYTHLTLPTRRTV